MRSIYLVANEITIFLKEAIEGFNALLNTINYAKVEIALATTKNAIVKSLINASGFSKNELVKKTFEIL